MPSRPSAATTVSREASETPPAVDENAVQLTATVGFSDLTCAEGQPKKRPSFAINAYTGAAVTLGNFYYPVIVDLSGLKAVVPGIAGMLGMNWGYFTFINTISAFIWAASHILPGYFAYDWLDSMGLSPELVMLLAATALGCGFILIHYWKPIVLLFTTTLSPRIPPPAAVM